jgi:UDP-glucose 4-epimerase
MGENPKGIPNNIMPYITQVASGRLEQLNIFGNDYETIDGTGVRDYIHVLDLADGHVKALDYLEKKMGIDVFNLGTGKGISVLELVNTFERVNEVTIKYQFVDRRPGDIALCFSNPEKAEQVLGWKTQHNLEDMCKDSWNWQKKNPNGYEIS